MSDGAVILYQDEQGVVFLVKSWTYARLLDVLCHSLTELSVARETI